MERIRGMYRVLNLSIYITMQWICCHTIVIIATVIASIKYNYVHCYVS